MKTGNDDPCLIVSPHLHTLLLRETMKYTEYLISPGLLSRMSLSSLSDTQVYIPFHLLVHDLLSKLENVLKKIIKSLFSFPPYPFLSMDKDFAKRRV